MSRDIEFLHEDVHEQHLGQYISSVGQWGIIAINWVDEYNSANISVLIAS